MGDDLCRLPYLFCLARTTKRIIRQNIGFSLGMKALALSLVFLVLLTLVMAILADYGAALVVIANALRLLGVRVVSGKMV
jgi:Cd2+/Zn2+-exporting ATPase